MTKITFLLSLLQKVDFYKMLNVKKVSNNQFVSLQVICQELFVDQSFRNKMPIFECKTLPMNCLYMQEKMKQVFCQQPVAITQGNEVIQIEKIEKNFIKEIQTSTMTSLIVMNLLGEKDKSSVKGQFEMIKISMEYSLRDLFAPQFNSQGQVDNWLHNFRRQIMLKKIIKPEQHQSQSHHHTKSQSHKQLQTNQKQFTSYSLRVFPFHKSITQFSMYLHQYLISLSQYDILSYQKTHRFCNYQYIIGLQGYEEEVCQKIETQVYLNWGDEPVEFVITNKHGTSYIHQLRRSELIIVPPMSTCKWRLTTTIQHSICKLLSWRIIPKPTFSTLLTHLQHKKLPIHYPIHQLLIDYCFHEFALIKLQSEQLVYTLANIINREFMNQLYVVEHVLKMNESQKMNGANQRKVDQCQICGKFIVNYFGTHKNVVTCLDCVKTNVKAYKVLHKMPKQTFQLGCQILTRINSYKEQLQRTNSNIDKIMQNAMFFQYEDICDGQFIGSYHSIHCRINETNHKNIGNSKDKIVQNTINRLKKELSISNVIDIIKKYSDKEYENEEEKRLYRKILTRASKFMSKKQNELLLSEMLPSYQESNLKLYAIKLCVKDNF